MQATDEHTSIRRTPGNAPTTFEDTGADSEEENVSNEQMQAIVQDRYGSAAVLELRTIDRPEVASDQVLIEVHAAGVARGVWHLMTGLPYVIRVAGYGFRSPKNPVVGLDVAGRVVAIGDNVTRFEPGDEVFGVGKGSYAQYATADQNKLAKKPTNATFEEAAVAAVSGITALEALIDVGKVQSGQNVLIIGASGGVGTFAVQLAKTLGAHVTGVSGPAMTETVRSLGADRVIDYTREDFVDNASQYDLIIDIGGRNSISRLRSVLAPKGTLVIVGGEGGNRLTGGVGRQIRAMMLSPFIGQRLTTFISSETHINIERLAAYIEGGDVTSTIGHRFSLAEVPVAMEELETSHSSGQSVIVVRHDDQDN